MGAGKAPMVPVFGPGRKIISESQQKGKKKKIHHVSCNWKDKRDLYAGTMPEKRKETCTRREKQAGFTKGKEKGVTGNT